MFESEVSHTLSKPKCTNIKDVHFAKALNYLVLSSVRLTQITKMSLCRNALLSKVVC